MTNEVTTIETLINTLLADMLVLNNEHQHDDYNALSTTLKVYVRKYLVDRSTFVVETVLARFGDWSHWSVDDINYWADWYAAEEKGEQDRKAHDAAYSRLARIADAIGCEFCPCGDGDEYELQVDNIDDALRFGAESGSILRTTDDPSLYRFAFPVS